MIYAGLLLLATGSLHAQDDDNWDHISPENIVSKDTFVRKGYTLIFINKSPGFDDGIKKRMVDAFYTVYPKEAKMYNKKRLRKWYF